MCTVTSHLHAGRLLVTMNRDEYRARGPELPPAAYAADAGISWIAPLDSPSGGTWIGANRHGLVACLLNAYLADEAESPEPGRHVSRGAIIPSLMVQGDYASALPWLTNSFDPSPFAPFTMLIASTTGRHICHWRGVGKLELRSLADDWQLVTSSSWNADEVLPWRRRQFQRWVQDGAMIFRELPTFHLLQPDGKAEWSPLMARQKTVTRSITQVAVDARAGKIILRYWPDPTPDSAQRPAQTVLRLDLQRSIPQ